MPARPCRCCGDNAREDGQQCGSNDFCVVCRPLVIRTVRREKPFGLAVICYESVKVLDDLIEAEDQ